MASPVEDIRASLGLEHVQTYEAIAAKGIGVFETLEGLGREVLGRLRHKAHAAQSRR